MSVTRNFFMERKLYSNNYGIFKIFKLKEMENITSQKLSEMGIKIRNADQAVGTMSGGERQSLAIFRAVHFGAKVLILDEPTAALGVTQTIIVLKTVAEVRKRGISIIFITHNVRHAYAVGDRFTVLNRGHVLDVMNKKDATLNKLQSLMAGGKDLDDLSILLGNSVRNF